jgi:hypothetical protein
MVEKLKECPFCGRSAVRTMGIDASNKPTCGVSCICCTGNVESYYNQDDADEAWSTRHNTTEISDPFSVIQEKQDNLFIQEVMKPEVSELLKGIDAINRLKDFSIPEEGYSEQYDTAYEEVNQFIQALSKRQD